MNSTDTLNWIPIEKSLPEGYQIVVCLHRCREKKEMYNICLAWYNPQNRKWRRVGDGFVGWTGPEISQVAYWFPLPDGEVIDSDE